MGAFNGKALEIHLLNVVTRQRFGNRDRHRLAAHEIVFKQIHTRKIFRILEDSLIRALRSLALLADLAAQDATFRVIVKHIFGGDILINLLARTRNIFQFDKLSIQRHHLGVDRRGRIRLKHHAFFILNHRLSVVNRKGIIVVVLCDNDFIIPFLCSHHGRNKPSEQTQHHAIAS